MSIVLRKKISAAGGLPQKLMQCDPLWAALMAADQNWSKQVYKSDLAGRMTNSRIIGGATAQRELGHRFAFMPQIMSGGPLLAVAIDRAGAARYAATRLRQPTENLLQAADLFLKLMCEQPANELWQQVESALQPDAFPGMPTEVTDASAVPDGIDSDVRVAQITIAMAPEGGEDGWLLEGGEDPPEIDLFFDLSKLEAVAAEFRERSRPKSLGGGHDREMLRSRMRSSSVRLDVVLGSIVLSVGECSRLKVGDVLDLPDVENGKLTLCAETMTGQGAIATGEMGNWKGHRALKLDGPVVESFLRELAEN